MSARADAAASRGTPVASTRERLALQLLAFFGLATFASLRYAQLLSAPPAGRVVLAAACATAGGGALALTRRLHGGAGAGVLRALVVAATLAGALLAVGVPAHMLAPAGWTSLASHVRTGIGRLGAWLWPYRGADTWARASVLLVIPATLVAAGCFAFWPTRRSAGAREMLALSILIAVFLAGAANTPAAVPQVEGIALLALLAGWLLAPRTAASDVGRGARWLLACALAGLLAEPLLAGGAPWISYREAPGPPAAVSFRWDQTYGPVPWSRSTAPIFTVAAPQPWLLRVTSLDRFDGVRFLRSASPPGSRALDVPRTALAPGELARATIQVGTLRSDLLVAGGGVATSVRWLSGAPRHAAVQADGTVALGEPSSKGAVYEVSSYEPAAQAARARRAPRAFPRRYLPYAQFELPAAPTHAPVPSRSVVVGPPRPGASPASSPTASALIEASPYAGMFALARRLATGARSDYAVALRVERYLRSGFAYDERVRAGRYPLDAFLFEARRGYCEQFSGAMALMLRMDGIPARVGVGFRPALYSPQSGAWAVRPIDAHAWVEVFFAGVGWIDFDPTPSGGAIGYQTDLAISKAALLGGAGAGRPARSHGRAPRAAAHSHHPPLTGRWPARLAAGALLLALAAALALALRARAGRRRAAAQAAAASVDRLRRALRAAGRGNSAMTLRGLERELEREGETQAAAYVRFLREQRYAAAQPPRVPARGRAALRRALSRSLGPAARMRVALALARR